MNQEGLRILVRTFKFQENTAEEIDARIGMAWGKYHSLKRILTAPTPLPHRLTILKACIGQSLLWGSETWHPTQRSLQKLRGAELRMHKAMIPPPPGADRQKDPDFHEKHKHHIREILRQNQYIGFDRQWLKRYHGWAGHVARLGGERWARKLLDFKNIKWWRAQQQLKTGHRHSKRRGNISKWEASLVRHHPWHGAGKMPPKTAINGGKLSAISRGLFLGKGTHTVLMTPL